MVNNIFFVNVTYIKILMREFYSCTVNLVYLFLNVLDYLCFLNLNI